MESEKVKEIKKGLECCTNPVYCENKCPYYIYERNLECINELTQDTLTLINELESENEQLKDRIAELEKENEKLKSTNTNILKSCDEYKNRHLKQFAERLKENFRKNNLESGIWFTNISIVDETLNEFIAK